MTLHLDKLSTVGKFIAQEEEWWLLKAEGGQNGELLLNGYAFPFRKIGKILDMVGSYGCKTMAMYLMLHNFTCKNG